MQACRSVTTLDDGSTSRGLRWTKATGGTLACRAEGESGPALYFERQQAAVKALFLRDGVPLHSAINLRGVVTHPPKELSLVNDALCEIDEHALHLVIGFEELEPVQVKEH